MAQKSPPPYRLVGIHEEAKRFSLGLQQGDQAIIAEKIGFIVQDPYRPKTKQLEGLEWEREFGKPVRRIRAGDHRVLYCVDDETRAIEIVAIRRRVDAYGGH